MERVQFQQEQMLPELKDLVERGLFTPNEIKAVIKKRTALESKLIRRAPRKADYLAYIAYEAELEGLRKKRLARLKGKMKEENEGKIPKLPRSISDYALVRRQFAIFERAVKRFRDDKGLWSAYVELARREKAWVLVGRVCARAIQMHPNTPAFYILAAQTELERHAPSAARGLLQRGIRMNEENESLWVEYVRLEMNFVEGLRRRWSVLGISVGGKGEGEERETVDVDREEEASADRAREQILQGAIVKSVLESAAKARPTIALFKSLEDLIRTYPTPVDLKTSLIDYLHTLITQYLPHDPQAIVFTATRSLRPIPDGAAQGTLDLEGEALVDALQRANEALLAHAHELANKSDSGVDTNIREQVQKAYAAFVEEWTARLEDQHPDLADLAKYLVLSLRALVKRAQKTKSPHACAPGLLAADLRLALRTTSTAFDGGSSKAKEEVEKAVRRARVYCSNIRGSGNGEVWIARLDLERAAETRSEEVRNVWREARRAVVGNEEEVERVWLWGIEDNDDEKVLEELIGESGREAKWRSVHEVLLLRWVERVVYRGRYVGEEVDAMDVDPGNGAMAIDAGAGKDGTDQRSGASEDVDAARRQRLLAAMPGLWRPTGSVWARVLQKEESESVARVAYERWKAGGDEKGATLGWAGWLVRHGQGARAAGVVDSVRGAGRDDVVAAWAEVLRTGQVAMVV